MIVRKFVKSDLYQLDIRKQQINDWALAIEMKDMVEAQYAFTAIDDNGKVIAMAGMLAVSENIGTIWALFSDDIHTNKLSIIKHIKRHINWLQKCGFYHLDTLVRMDFPEAIRFIEALGFTRTGEKRRYRFDLDYWEYSLVEERD